MRRHLFSSLTLLAVVPFALQGQEPVSRSFPLNPDGSVRIANLADAGSIRVIGWDRDSVVITGSTGRGAKLWAGGSREGVKMYVDLDKTAFAKLPGSTDLVVRVPARARIWVNSAMAEVEVTSVSGQVDVTAVGSHVRVQGTPSELRAETMNGDLDVVASPAYLRLKTATGHISWTGSSEDVVLTTVSGKLVVNGGTFTRARFESIDGDIRFSGGVTKTASVVFDTHSGDITVLLPKDAEVSVEADGPTSDLFGKRSKSAADPARPEKNYASVGKPPDAGARIVIRSFKGRITAAYQ